MSTLKEQLKNTGFGESFTPQLTDSWVEDRDENLGKISYIYKEIEHPKGVVKIFTFTNWHDGHKTLTEKPEKLLKKDETWIEAKLRANNLQIEDEKESRYLIAKAEAQKIWDESLEPKQAPTYLEKRGITHIKDYRVDKETGEIVIVPIYNSKMEIESLQHIFPDGQKQNLSGGKTDGNFSIVRGEGDTVLVSEGFATALSVHMATGATVYVSLNAKNIPATIQAVISQVDQKYFIIAADNDKHTTPNHGLNAAFKAAKKYGCTVKYPTFVEYKDKETTDFDDLRREEGLEEVARQLQLTDAEKESYEDIPELIPLGRKGKMYYFTSTQNPDVQSFESLPKDSLWKIIRKEYWENRYGVENKQGDLIVDWDAVVSSVYADCQALKEYDEETVRGTGIYIDKGEKIFHFGSKIYIDGKLKKFHAIKSGNVYVPRKEVSSLHDSPLDDASTQEVWNSFDLTNITNKDKKRFLLGWVVCGILSGCLDWRPHIYLTGPKGAGKTQILEFLSRLLSKGFDVVHMPAVHSTAIGLRQAIASKAIPCIIDEVEGENNESKAKAERIINFCRISSSNSEGSVLLGTASQNVKKSSYSICALLSGINPQIRMASDFSRFSFIEISVDHSVPGEIRADNWRSAKKIWDKVDKEWSRRFVARVLENLDTILWNINTFRDFLEDAKLGDDFERRDFDQNGTLIAASAIWEHTRKLTVPEMKELSKMIVAVKKGDTVRSTQEEACLKFILETYIMDESGIKTTIISEISKPEISAASKKAMKDFGVTVIKRRGAGKEDMGLNIRQTSHLDQRLKDSSFQGGYLDILKRIPGAINNHKLREGGYGIFIPISKCIGDPNAEVDDVDNTVQF